MISMGGTSLNVLANPLIKLFNQEQLPARSPYALRDMAFNVVINNLCCVIFKVDEIVAVVTIVKTPQFW